MSELTPQAAFEKIAETLDSYCGGVAEKSTIAFWRDIVRAALAAASQGEAEREPDVYRVATGFGEDRWFYTRGIAEDYAKLKAGAVIKPFYARSAGEGTGELRDAMERASNILRGGPTAADAKVPFAQRVHDAANILDSALLDGAQDTQEKR